MDVDIAEGFKRMLEDPYSPGITHGGGWPDDLAKVANDLLWNKSYKEFTITVKKEEDNYHISYRVDGRSNGTETSGL